MNTKIQPFKTEDKNRKKVSALTLFIIKHREEKWKEKKYKTNPTKVLTMLQEKEAEERWALYFH